MASDKPDTPFIRANFGDTETHYELHYPRLNADGSVHLWPQDGRSIFTVPVPIARHYYTTFTVGLTLAHSIHSIEPEKNSLILYRLNLMVTDARVVIVGDLEPKFPGRRLVAHLWYPWIDEVGFRPKQSFLNDSALSFGYRQAFPLAERGSWFHRLELDFDKSFHPRETAREIVRRLAAHHLANNPPASAVEAARALLKPEELADPPKGDFASYYPPAYVAWPGGVPYIESRDEDPWEWTVTSGAADSNPSDAAVDGMVEATEVPPGPVRPTAANNANEGADADEAEDDVADVPLPRLKLRAHLALARDMIVALGHYEADEYALAAPIYDRILAMIDGKRTGLNVAQVHDLYERAAVSSARAGNTEKAVAHCESALRIALRERDESMELQTRAHLADVLDGAPSHPRYVENLLRMSELFDALRSRVERVDFHFKIARALRAGEHFAEAAAEYAAVAELRSALGEQARQGVALAWQARVLRDQGEDRASADAIRDRSRGLLAGQELSPEPEETLPTMFEMFSVPAKRAVVRAQDAAEALGHLEIRPEHVLIGAALVPAEVEAILSEAGLTPEVIREQVRGKAPREWTVGPDSPSRIHLGQEGRAALTTAYQEALSLSHGDVASGHLVLGAMQAAAVDDILRALAIDVDRLTEEIRSLLAR